MRERGFTFDRFRKLTSTMPRLKHEHCGKDHRSCQRPASRVCINCREIADALIGDNRHCELACGMLEVGNGELRSHQLHGFAGCGDCAFQLGVFYGAEDLFEGRARVVAGGDEFAAGDERTRAHGFRRHGLPAFADKLPMVEVAAAGEAIHAVEGEMLIEGGELEEALEG